MEGRREQLDWLLEERYWHDVESDLSAFHRVDDYLTLDGPRFFRFAVRLSAYTGALAARLFSEEQEREQGGGHSYTPPAVGKGGGSRDRPVAVSEEVLLAKLASEGWVERKGGQPPI